MVVIALFILLIWRGSRLPAMPGQLGSLLAFTTSWMFSALINVSVIVGLLPFAGNALLHSAGGSSMTATMAAIGS